MPPAKVVINLATGLEDAERVTVAFLVGGAGATTLWEWIGDDHATVFSY